MHCKCVDLHENSYKAITDLKLHWYCPQCDGASSKLHQWTVKLQAEQDQMKLDIADLSIRIGETENRIINKINTEVDTKIDAKVQVSEANIMQLVDAKINTFKEEYKPEWPQLPAPLNPDGRVQPNAPNTSVKFNTAVNEAITEREEQQSRKLNLMVINLTEAESAEEDTAQMKVLLETKMNIEDEIVIKEFTRLGRVREDGKPRLVRVQLQDLTMKRKILSSATKLRKLAENDPFAKVYVKPDLTKKQQAESKNLFTALKAQRAQDQDNRYIISKGKIIRQPLED